MAQLSQAVMNRIGRDTEAMNGTLLESVTYRAKATSLAVVITHTVQGRFLQYSDHVTALHSLVPEGQVRREDRQFRVAFAVVTWTPSLYDEVLRADGSLWRVLSIGGGGGRPWWILQVRKVVVNG